jgi:hypothetical protein
MVSSIFEKKSLEAPGFEPGAFRMRSGHSTTELCPLIVNWNVITVIAQTFAKASFLYLER